MRRPHRHALIALNAALLAALGWSSLVAPRRALPIESEASAQPKAAAARPRGEYLLLSGKMSVGSGQAVYIVDIANEEILAAKWDRARERFTVLGLRSIVRDAGGPGPQLPGGGGR